MSWRTKTVIRILLIVAKFINDDDNLNGELRTLATHINAQDL